MNVKVFNIRLCKEHSKIDQEKMNEFLDSVEVKLTSTHFVVTNSIDYWSAVVFYKPKKIEVHDLSKEGQEILNALKDWRNTLAKKRNWSAFRICHNSHLLAIINVKPETLEDFRKVDGFGETRTHKYGDEILSVLNAFFNKQTT